MGVDHNKGCIAKLSIECKRAYQRRVLPKGGN